MARANFSQHKPPYDSSLCRVFLKFRALRIRGEGFEGLGVFEEALRQPRP